MNAESGHGAHGVRDHPSLNPPTGPSASNTVTNSPQIASFDASTRPEVKMRDASGTDQDASSEWSRDDQRWGSWMSAAQRGDKKAYERLLNELAVAITQYLRARFGPADFVDDILQECLLSVHKGRHTYDARRPFRAWLFAIVRHRSVDFLRRHGRDGGSAATIDPDLQPHAGKVTTIVEASLILSQLKQDHRDIIVLTKYLGYSAQEVGSQLGISVAAVRVRLHRALQQTRRLIDKEDIEQL